jgi:hypothetical protein
MAWYWIVLIGIGGIAIGIGIALYYIRRLIDKFFD